jgi:hypothetical protein
MKPSRLETTCSVTDLFGFTSLASGAPFRSVFSPVGIEKGMDDITREQSTDSIEHGACRTFAPFAKVQVLRVAPLLQGGILLLACITGTCACG